MVKRPWLSTLFKWFLDLNVQDEPFHPTTFTKNRERLLEADAARVLLKEVAREARRRWLLSADHFTVDGTLLEAWASHKSCRPRDEGPARAAGATDRATSRASDAAARRTSRPPIPRRGSTARAPSSRRSSTTWAIC